MVTSGACGTLRLVGGRHNNVGVSLLERRYTTQVMLGVSLRARYDTTLVSIITVRIQVDKWWMNPSWCQEDNTPLTVTIRYQEITSIELIIGDTKLMI